MKDLLKLMDLSREDILHILDTADQMKYSQKHGIPHQVLAGKTLAMIFEKNSTRTRVSFETGMYQLGGHALFLSGKESQIGRGEPIEDTARVLSRYCDGIMIRTYGQEEVETLAQYADIPVINTLDDTALNEVKEKGDYLREQIEALNLPCLGWTRGLGLMIGIQVRGDFVNKELAARLMDAGLLVLTAGNNVIRLLPPLLITKEEIDKGLKIMRDTLEGVGA